MSNLADIYLNSDSSGKLILIAKLFNDVKSLSDQIQFLQKQIEELKKTKEPQ